MQAENNAANYYKYKDGHNWPLSTCSPASTVSVWWTTAVNGKMAENTQQGCWHTSKSRSCNQELPYPFFSVFNPEQNQPPHQCRTDILMLWCQYRLLWSVHPVVFSVWLVSVANDIFKLIRPPTSFYHELATYHAIKYREYVCRPELMFWSSCAYDRDRLCTQPEQSI